MKKGEYKTLRKRFLKDGFDILNKSNYKEVIDNLILETKIENIELKVNLILIGVSTELILKAAYISKGYLIYKTKTPIKLNEFKDSWNYKKTLDFNELIENCGVLFNKNIKSANLKKIKDVLHQIRMWRNDEIHSFTEKPNLKAEDYIKIIDTILTIAGKVK